MHSLSVATRYMNPVRPEISIIIPVYKVEKYIRKCIESVAVQTLRNIEIILVDDGSPDRCGEICDEYAASDPRIKVIHRNNGGLSAARNTGLSAATAGIIGFVDGDDWVEPEMFQQLYDAMCRTSADMAVCNVCYDFVNERRSDKSTATVEQVFDRDTAIEMLLFDRKMHNYVWNKIFKRELLTVYFPENRSYEDVHVMIKWVANIRNMVQIPFCGYHYVQRMGSYLHNADLARYVSRVNALESQVGFIRESGLAPDIRKDYYAYVIRQVLSCAKYMVRSLPFDKNMADCMEYIVSFVVPLADEAAALLKPKQRRRLSLLINHRYRFMVLMRLGGMFQRLGFKKGSPVCYE